MVYLFICLIELFIIGLLNINKLIIYLWIKLIFTKKKGPKVLGWAEMTVHIYRCLTITVLINPFQLFRLFTSIWVVLSCPSSSSRSVKPRGSGESWPTLARFVSTALRGSVFLFHLWLNVCVSTSISSSAGGKAWATWCCQSVWK